MQPGGQDTIADGVFKLAVSEKHFDVGRIEVCTILHNGRGKVSRGRTGKRAGEENDELARTRYHLRQTVHQAKSVLVDARRMTDQTTEAI